MHFTIELGLVIIYGYLIIGNLSGAIAVAPKDGGFEQVFKSSNSEWRGTNVVENNIVVERSLAKHKGCDPRLNEVFRWDGVEFVDVTDEFPELILQSHIGCPAFVGKKIIEEFAGSKSKLAAEFVGRNLVKYRRLNLDFNCSNENSADIDAIRESDKIFNSSSERADGIKYLEFIYPQNESSSWQEPKFRLSAEASKQALILAKKYSRLAGRNKLKKRDQILIRDAFLDELQRFQLQIRDSSQIGPSDFQYLSLLGGLPFQSLDEMKMRSPVCGIVYAFEVMKKGMVLLDVKEFANSDFFRMFQIQNVSDLDGDGVSEYWFYGNSDYLLVFGSIAKKPRYLFENATTGFPDRLYIAKNGIKEVVYSYNGGNGAGYSGFRSIGIRDGEFKITFQSPGSHWNGTHMIGGDIVVNKELSYKSAYVAEVFRWNGKTFVDVSPEYLNLAFNSYLATRNAQGRELIEKEFVRRGGPYVGLLKDKVPKYRDFGIYGENGMEIWHELLKGQQGSK